MVSKARLDLPDPDSPVITTSASRGSATEMSLRLCSLAPETTIWLPAAIAAHSIRANRCSPDRPGAPAIPAGRRVRALALDRGVHLVDQLLAVRQLEVLGQVAIGRGAGFAVEGHVQGDQ